MTSLSSLVADAQERGLVAVNAARDVRTRRTGADRRAEKRQESSGSVKMFRLATRLKPSSGGCPAAGARSC